MSYLVARACGPNKNDLTFQQLGCSSGSTVSPLRTRFTGLMDAEGNPIHRVAQARPKIGFHSTQS